MSDDDLMAPGPLPGQVYSGVISELTPFLEEVDHAATTLLQRVDDLMTARTDGYGARLTDWSGPLRSDFDDQFPASQAELSALIDAVQALQAQARSAVSGYASQREAEARSYGTYGPVEYV